MQGNICLFYIQSPDPGRDLYGSGHLFVSTNSKLFG